MHLCHLVFSRLYWRPPIAYWLNHRLRWHPSLRQKLSTNSRIKSARNRYLQHHLHLSIKKCMILHYRRAMHSHHWRQISLMPIYRPLLFWQTLLPLTLMHPDIRGSWFPLSCLQALILKRFDLTEKRECWPVWRISISNPRHMCKNTFDPRHWNSIKNRANFARNLCRA